MNLQLNQRNQATIYLGGLRTKIKILLMKSNRKMVMLSEFSRKFQSRIKNRWSLLSKIKIEWFHRSRIHLKFRKSSLGDFRLPYYSSDNTAFPSSNSSETQKSTETLSFKGYVLQYPMTIWSSWNLTGPQLQIRTILHTIRMKRNTFIPSSN